MEITEKEIKRYFELNTLKKEIEQEMNEFKKQFHQYLDHQVGKNEKGDVQRGNYKLQRQIRKSISYQNESTIQKLEDLNLGEFIVVEKRPDKDKLEAAFKLGLVEEDKFRDCMKTRLTQTIVVRETFSE